MTKPMHDATMLFAERWLAARRLDLNEALDLCESPIERALLAALLCQTDGTRSHFHLGPPPYKRGAPIATCGPWRLTPQYHVLSRRLDLAITQRGKGIDDGTDFAIECDGAEHHREREDREADARRDRELVAYGWRVLRFTGSEIHRDADVCAAQVCRLLGLEVGAPTPHELARTMAAPMVSREVALGAARCKTVEDEDAMLRAAQERGRRRHGIGGAE